jgi:hypothetical protein
MYNNFVTLQQRRIQAQLAQEQRDRIRMVEDLKVRREEEMGRTSKGLRRRGEEVS